MAGGRPRAGVLDSIVTVMVGVESRNADYGNAVITYSDAFTAWGMVEELDGREYYAARAVGASRPVRVTLRYRDDLSADTKYRLRLEDGRVLDVASVVAVGRRAFVVLLCEEIRG